MNIYFTKQGEDMLKRHEGLRLTAYKDTMGLKTIGYGHNLAAEPTFRGRAIPDTITQEFADELFDHDVGLHVEALIDAITWFKHFTRIEPARADVLVNMCFNMGPSKFPKKWPKFIEQLNTYEFDAAAANMLATPWAKQVKGRAKELAEIIETGDYK